MAALEIVVVAVLILLNGHLAICELAIVVLGAATLNVWQAADTPQEDVCFCLIPMKQSQEVRNSGYLISE